MRLRAWRPMAVAISMIVSLGCGKPATTQSDADGPRVVVLRYQVGSASTEQREQGFVETLRRDYPQIQILSDELYSGATREGALQRAENLLTRFGDRIDGWFCPCEPVTFGTLRAVQNRDMTGKFALIGFDAATEMVAAVGNGEISALVLQDPVNMGYLAVKTAAAAIKNQPVEAKVSTGEFLLTRENMDDPQMRALHSPDLEQWLQMERPVSGSRKYRIAVIPKGTLHDFWKSIHAGALKAEKELEDVEVIWKGPTREDDREQQIQVVENFVNSGVDAIVLAPLDKVALVPAVELANRKKIPVVIFDSGLDHDDVVSYVATDNYNGGALAAHHMAKLLLGDANAPAAAEE